MYRVIVLTFSISTFALLVPSCPIVPRDQDIDRYIGGTSSRDGDMSGDGNTSDESVTGREEYAAERSGQRQ